ncbi:MAG: COX15/CtaA family protein [Planctomycetaceae bacterium]|nr:COX15/CtaA family protein [Planctomycetaceae bacterium]
MSAPNTTIASPWPHRLAVVLVCATFPLIWVGGMVTSFEAGMAVPDWPGTYGYNMFLYPWETWLFGPFDILVEHGHRLFGAVVGMLTIALLVSAWVTRAPRWLQQVCWAALALVIAQGVIGGMRVVLDARHFAQLHGATGPVFFALTVVLATLTSQRWSTVRSQTTTSAGALHRLLLITSFLAYLQIVLGTQLRHLTAATDAATFRVLLVFHIVGAVLVVVHAMLSLQRVRREHADQSWLIRPALGLTTLVGAQVALGLLTWIVNYGWPVWFRDYAWAASYVVQDKSYSQALTSTAHVAFGSLIFATSVLLTVRSFRAVRSPAAAVVSVGSWSLGASL